MSSEANAKKSIQEFLESIREEIAAKPPKTTIRVELSDAAYHAICAAIANRPYEWRHSFDRSLIESLAELDVASSTAVTDSTIAQIAELIHLESLAVHNTPISDIGPLAKLTRLQGLTIDHTQVRDLSPLRGLTELSTLWGHKTPIVDVEPLSNLMSLTFINLGFTLIDDISPLIKLPALSTLGIEGTKISHDQVFGFHLVREQLGLPKVHIRW